MYFPHPLSADHDGLLAIGGDLSVERLLFAYRYGIFPWYNDPPVMWWWTHSRCVLFPSKVKVSKSMRPYFNQKKYSVSYNQAFESVIKACASLDRPQQMGTWINKDMIDSYISLHQQGYAHSVEVWRDDELVGGLYGIGLGDIFYGESMFTHATNASKFGFITLCRKLEEIGIKLIDCQQETNHLISLGAEQMPKEEFWQYISDNQAIADRPIRLND